jgi:hypothetical protein
MSRKKSKEVAESANTTPRNAERAPATERRRYRVIHIVEAMLGRGADMRRAAFKPWRNSAEFMTWTRITGT